MGGYTSFMNDMAAYLRRKTADIGQRQSLFEGVSPGNVGNVFDIPPSESPTFTNVFSTNAYGNPVRVLEIVGDDALGEMICVSIQHERILDDAGNAIISTDNVEGPLVGIVEFGAGAGLSAFEFDITSPVLTPGFVRVQDAITVDIGNTWNDRLLPFRRLNGILLSLPASSMRVFVRNDANAPYIIQGGGTSLAAPVSFNPFKQPAKVRVHATYGRRPYPHTLFRTIPICFNTDFSGSGGAGVTNEFIGTEDGNYIAIMIPQYAKRVFFPRARLQSTSLAVNFLQSVQRIPGGSVFRGQYTIPIGEDGPLEIYPYDTFIQISNPGPEAIRNLSLVFELSI